MPVFFFFISLSPPSFSGFLCTVHTPGAPRPLFEKTIDPTCARANPTLVFDVSSKTSKRIFDCPTPHSYLSVSFMPVPSGAPVFCAFSSSIAGFSSDHPFLDSLSKRVYLVTPRLLPPPVCFLPPFLARGLAGKTFEPHHPSPPSLLLSKLFFS